MITDVTEIGNRFWMYQTEKQVLFPGKECYQPVCQQIWSTLKSGHAQPVGLYQLLPSFAPSSLGYRFKQVSICSDARNPEPTAEHGQLKYLGCLSGSIQNTKLTHSPDIPFFLVNSNILCLQHGFWRPHAKMALCITTATKANPSNAIPEQGLVRCSKQEQHAEWTAITPWPSDTQNWRKEKQKIRRK